MMNIILIKEKIFLGLKDFNFSYDQLIEDIDNYVINELIPYGINKAEQDIKDAKKAEADRLKKEKDR